MLSAVNIITVSVCYTLNAPLNFKLLTEVEILILYVPEPENNSREINHVLISRYPRVSLYYSKASLHNIVQTWVMKL